jgi:transposase
VGDRRGTYRILVRKPEGKKPLEDPEVDGRIILSWIFRKWTGGMEWIDLDQGRGRWHALVNAAMNLWLP